MLQMQDSNGRSRGGMLRYYTYRSRHGLLLSAGIRRQRNTLGLRANVMREGGSLQRAGGQRRTCSSF